MKKILVLLLTMMMLVTLTACGKKAPEKEINQNESNNNQQENNYIVDDEIIDLDDEDNNYYGEEKVVVERTVNCEGCVFAYFSDEGDKAKTLGSTLSKDEYTADISNLKTSGGKQRHNFFGLVLSDNKIFKRFGSFLHCNPGRLTASCPPLRSNCKNQRKDLPYNRQKKGCL